MPSLQALVLDFICKCLDIQALVLDFIGKCGWKKTKAFAYRIYSHFKQQCGIISTKFSQRITSLVTFGIHEALMEYIFFSSDDNYKKQRFQKYVQSICTLISNSSVAILNFLGRNMKKYEVASTLIFFQGRHHNYFFRSSKLEYWVQINWVTLKIRQSKINSRSVARPMGQMNCRPSV